MVELRGKLVGGDRRHLHGVLLHRALDREAVAVDRRHVLGVGVAHEDVVAVADEPGGDGPADRPAADDDVPHVAVRAAPAACPFPDVRSRMPSISRPVVRM